MAKPKTRRKPPPEVIYVVVDRSDVFSHTAHKSRRKAQAEARSARQMWTVYDDRGPFQVIRYRRERSKRVPPRKDQKE